MELSFTNKECKFWAKNTVMYYPQKSLKMLSSLIIAFFSFLNLSNFVRHNVLAAAHIVVVETCTCSANCGKDS
jgi:hypothetical protein